MLRHVLWDEPERGWKWEREQSRPSGLNGIGRGVVPMSFDERTYLRELARTVEDISKLPVQQ